MCSVKIATKFAISNTHLLRAAQRRARLRNALLETLLSRFLKGKAPGEVKTFLKNSRASIGIKEKCACCCNDEHKNKLRGRLKKHKNDSAFSSPVSNFLSRRLIAVSLIAARVNFEWQPLAQLTRAKHRRTERHHLSPACLLSRSGHGEVSRIVKTT